MADIYVKLRYNVFLYSQSQANRVLIHIFILQNSILIKFIQW